METQKSGSSRRRRTPYKTLFYNNPCVGGAYLVGQYLLGQPNILSHKSINQHM